MSARVSSTPILRVVLDTIFWGDGQISVGDFYLGDFAIYQVQE